MLVMGLLVILMFSSLIFKLYDIQVVRSNYYQENYTQLTRKTQTTPATRGRIYDRNGELLAYNELTYSATFIDTGKLPDGFAKNEMLIPLIELLKRHGATIAGSFPMSRDSGGNLVFTTRTEGEKRVLLMNIYGISDTADFDTEDRYGNVMYANPDPEYFYRYALHKFGIGFLRAGYNRKNEADYTYELDPDTALTLLNLRYSMYLMSYMKYESVDIALNLDLSTVTEILERSSEFPDVRIEEGYIRKYNYSEYYSHILGYTGVADPEKLKELKELDPTYEDGDVVGRAGLEEIMEAELSGTKGSCTLMLDSEGRIRETMDEVDPKTGDDLYLTLDTNLMIAVYHILEQKLAGILCARLVDYDVNLDEVEDSTKIEIPVKDAYFQLINNNVLSMARFAEPDASAPEREMYERYQTRMAVITEELRSLLLNQDLVTFNDQPAYLQDYYNCLYDFLISNGYLSITESIRGDEMFRRWNTGRAGLPEFLHYAIEKSWIHVTSLTHNSRYTTTEETFQMTVDTILEQMQTYTPFGKLAYKYLIKDEFISGRQVCLALYEQGVLPWDEERVNYLLSGGSPYQFLYEKIQNLEITPAQLALDPCTASCSIIDVNTGEPLAIVSYPGYDNNMFSGTVNAEYYYSLLNDMSRPLYNNATQARTAPGSTFKMLTSVAGLEEGVIDPYETIHDNGIFTENNLKLRCWIYPDTHGDINVTQALRDSCNYFFSEVGWRLSKDSNGNYNEPLGLSRIRKYASMFGFDRKTGVEMAELTPQITDIAPVPSSIGQGSHAYTNIQMARYATALATRGTVYQFTILNKRTNADGMVLQEYSSPIDNQIQISWSTWEAVQSGMRLVITNTIDGIFHDCPVAVAGKTGTAEESKRRGPHAVFVTYAPYSSPEIAFAVMIPYGYASSSAAEVAEMVYEYCYGDLTLETILTQGAATASGVTVHD